MIDFHTHIFPDHVAAKAIPALADKGKVRPHTDGTMDGLLASMDHNGISASVACMIATRPEQFSSILAWCEHIRSERVIPFPSVHPDAPDCLEQLRAIHEAGFKGIKMHPYYQEFTLTDEKMEPLYETVRELGLVLLMHTGFDVAFPQVRLADPEKIARVCRRFPGLRFVASHLGAWRLWDEVRLHMCGEPIYMDISFSLPFAGREKAREIILSHPPGYILFGSDSPWEDQGAALASLNDLGLPAEVLRGIKHDNAARLLGL